MTRACSILLFAAACGTATSPAPRPSEPRPVARAACGPEGAPTVHSEIGSVPAWRVARGSGTGGLWLDLDGDRVVAATQGGRTISVALADGACAVLLEGPPAQGVIDPYSTRSAILNGALVGPLGPAIGAVDARTGAVRWRRDLLPERQGNEYVLRDGWQGIAVSGVNVVAFPTLASEVEPYEWTEKIAGLDPTTGEVLWEETPVRHGAGVAVADSDRVRLHRALDRVLVERGHALSAIDPRTGQTVWSATTSGPVLAACGRILAGDGLYDAATGRLVRRIEGHSPRAETCVADDGSHRSATCAGDWTYAAETDAHGASALIAIAPDGRVAWTRSVGGCVMRARADSRAVYVLEGVERLWALDARDGDELWGLATGRTGDFVVVPSPSGARVVLPYEELIAVDVNGGDRPRSQRPYLRWNFSNGPECHARSVAWVDGNEQVVWERALPARAHVSCETDGATFHRDTPRATPAVPVLYFTDAVAVADPSGLLVLRSSDGTTVLDQPRAERGEALFFDHGRFELGDEPSCSGEAALGRIFARCGAHLLYFDGTTATLVDTGQWRVVARGTFDGTVSTTSHAQVGATVELGDRTLRLRGAIHMR